MKHDPEPICTGRLILRQWRPSDLSAWAALNADPEVRRFWPSTLTAQESDTQAQRFQGHIEQHGFGFWAMEAVKDSSFVGMTGIKHVGFSAPFTPAVEIGWRLAREHWGKGYATEAAKASLRDGFGRLGLSEIVAFAALGNAAAFCVMERIGMKRIIDGDFTIPELGKGPLARSALYRIKRQNANSNP